MSLKTSASRYMGAFDSSNPPALASWALSTSAPNVWQAPKAPRVATTPAPGFGDLEGIWGRLGRSYMDKRLGRRRTSKYAKLFNQQNANLGPNAVARPALLADGLSDGLSGAIDDLTSGATSFLNAANAKAEKLQNALYLIIGLSGVAALTGLVTASRSRRQ